MHSLGIYLVILKKISNSILINKSVNFTVRQKNEKTLILQFLFGSIYGFAFSLRQACFPPLSHVQSLFLPKRRSTGSCSQTGAGNRASS